MDTISTAELMDLSLTTISFIDSQFQYWVSITLAVIVASYLVGKKLSTAVRVMIVVLYGLTSFVFALRYAASVDQAFYIAEELLIRLPGWPRNGPVVTPVRSITFVTGVITTIWFLLFSRFTRRDSA